MAIVFGVFILVECFTVTISVRF